MSRSKFTVWVIAATILFSLGFVLYPQGSANAAGWCVTHLKGATILGGVGGSPTPPKLTHPPHPRCRARSASTVQSIKGISPRLS
jgi:hypothetical protein